MANIVNGTSTGAGGLITTGDSSDELQLQTAETTAITIDSSQNVGVGTTTPGAKIEATASGAAVQILNRTTSDGNILEFENDGTTVGSIGSRTSATGIFVDSASVGGILTIGGTECFAWDTTTFYPRTDNVRDLGISYLRYKDLYLSGSVFLGGTTSANALDDYEEGTWTPALVGASTAGTPSGTREGIYTKIGNFVYASFRFANYSVSGNSGTIIISGLPFTSTGRMNGTVSYAEGITFTLTAGTNNETLFVLGGSGATQVTLAPQNAGSAYDKVVTALSFAGSNGYMYGFITYPA